MDAAVRPQGEVRVAAGGGSGSACSAQQQFCSRLLEFILGFFKECMTIQYVVNMFLDCFAL